jgi:hypothetical protein
MTVHPNFAEFEPTIAGQKAINLESRGEAATARSPAAFSIASWKKSS